MSGVVLKFNFNSMTQFVDRCCESNTRVQLALNREQLFLVRERENFERSGISVPVVILLLVVAAVGQHVPLGVPGNSECWGRDADLGNWKERKQLISVTKQ